MEICVWAGVAAAAQEEVNDWDLAMQIVTARLPKSHDRSFKPVRSGVCPGGGRQLVRLLIHWDWSKLTRLMTIEQRNGCRPRWACVPRSSLSGFALERANRHRLHRSNT